MTGGAGFSRSAKQSFDENQKLGKFRDKQNAYSSAKRGNAVPKDLDDLIAHRYRRRDWYLRTRKIVLISFIIAAILFLGYLFVLA